MPFSEYGGPQPADWWQLEHWWEVPPGSSGEPIRPEVVLRQVAPNRFQLARGFRYELPVDDRGARLSPLQHAVWYLSRRTIGTTSPTAGTGGPWDVPPHNLRLNPRCAENWTDIASVPPWLWWFVSSHGRHSRAALLHDHLIRPGNAGVTDRQADHVLRMALRDSGVPVLRRWLMWNAVSLASLWRRGVGKVAVVLFALHVVAFISSLAVATTSSWRWLGHRLASPFVWIWETFLGDVARAAWSLATWVWSTTDWLLPHGLEGPWWKVTVFGLAGLIVWRKRWLITLVGLALVALPTIAVFVSYALALIADSAVFVVGKLASVLPGIEAPQASKPEFGRPYRQDIGRM